MERGTGTYNVGGALEASLNETIALLERISGRALETTHRPAVPGDQRRTSADTTRIRRELGWEPRVSLEDGLRAQWEWASTRVAALMSGERPAADLEAEREIDLRSWLERSSLSLVARGRGSRRRARSSAGSTRSAVGPPTPPPPSSPAARPSTRPVLVGAQLPVESLGHQQAFATSAPALRFAAAKAGMRVGELRGHVSTSTVAEKGQTATQNSNSISCRSLSR